MKQALIVFMKYPEAGKVKSRLAGKIGPIAATDVYWKLLYRTLGIVDDFKHCSPEVEVFVFFSPGERKNEVKRHFPGPWKFIPQAGCNLGERMSAAFRQLWDSGYDRVVIIGTDIADLNVNDLREAFDGIAYGTSVIGPAEDGGFYLLGLSSSSDLPFKYDSWGDGSIFDRTYRSLEKLGTVRVIKKRRDIDREEDLAYFQSSPFFQSKISVVIPFLSEREKLVGLVSLLCDQIWPGDEVIAIKGTEDPQVYCETVDPGFTLCFSPKGRGKQLNLGAKIASGDTLWFLHVDSKPPANFGYHVRKILALEKKAVGCFKLAFDTDSRTLRAIARWANIRTRLLKLPYGDQGIFCSRETFMLIGGFKKEYLMEDVDFVRKCRKLGGLLVVPRELYSSPERYLKRGLLMASLQNHILMTLYLMGVDDKKLYRIYYRKL